MTLKDKLLIYILRKNNEMESTSEALRYQIRTQPMDSLDHYEVICDKIRLSAWKEFTDELFKIVINCK